MNQILKTLKRSTKAGLFIFLLFFLAGKLGKVLVQVDLVADGHDDVAEHGFVFAMLVANVGQLAFKAEDVGQNVFQFINHVVVGCLSVVAGPLQL